MRSPDVAGVTPYYSDDLCVLYHRACEDVLPLLLVQASAIVTDPPYELGFMSKLWDSRGVSFRAATWGLVRSACKHGAPMLCFGGTRTFHRIAVALEDAGWELRDCIMWVYGSGFPKSLGLGKAVDAALGVGCEAVGTVPSHLWDGWGTALKPAWEPVLLAMNPRAGTFAENALVHGVAGLNVDGCRVPLADGEDLAVERDGSPLDTRNQGWGFRGVSRDNRARFPANFIHDGSDEVLLSFPLSCGQQGNVSSDGAGSAARFFYCAKASRAERDSGMDGAPTRLLARSGGAQGAERRGGATYLQAHIGLNRISAVRNNHPTVKPLALMRYLCRLVTMPQYNLILDPFCGSGTTLLASSGLGLPSIGVDSDEAACEIAATRLSYAAADRLRRGGQ